MTMTKEEAQQAYYDALVDSEYFDHSKEIGVPEDVRERIKMKDNEINAIILRELTLKYLERTDPCVGDWIIFVDGTERRISYVWKDYDKNRKPTGDIAKYSVQTSIPENAPHLSQSGYMSFSGTLFSPISGEHLERTSELRLAPVWIWNRGYAGADRGRRYDTPCKVWRANCLPPKVQKGYAMDTVFEEVNNSNKCSEGWVLDFSSLGFKDGKQRNSRLHWVFREAIRHPGIPFVFDYKERGHGETQFRTYRRFAFYDAERSLMYTNWAGCPRSVNHHVGSTCPVCGMKD